MDVTMSEYPLVVILGPTASGKTALSLELAREFDGEIVSCDSVAVYREFEIGTAKPSRDERASVPHHLIDVCDPSAPFTAGDYSRLGREALSSIRSRNKLPIIVGGTGLYLRALLEGLFPGPQRSEELRERLRSRVEQKGAPHLHRVLSRLDREAAKRIHPNDASKAIRAIEVSLASRQPITELWKQGRDPLQGFRILRLGLDPERSLLYARINERAARMFELGLVEETRELLTRYGDEDTATPLRSLGYKQALQFIRGELSLADAISAAQQGHRNYAKRQLTWFRREPDVAWINGFGDSTAVQERAAQIVRDFVQDFRHRG